MTDTTDVERLFHGAVERPRPERDAFLDEACRGRPEVRREIDSLLEAHARADDVFREPRFGLAPFPAEGEAERLVGESVGPFRLTRFVAEGGMGAVYEAQQESPRRRVALKLMKGSVGGAASRRFLEESEILARLEHPAIAHVYEAGVHRRGIETVPYFAMEFVEGAAPVTVHCRERGLGVRDRLALFGRFCDAVQHGHGRGIIHRDLKPSNLLVDGAGNPKVIDFGVARATNADVAVTALRTEPGRIVGTLQYMSPEQCDGDPRALDVRSDVYALGLVLYEIVCGERPYDVSKTSVAGALRLVREAAPRRPRAIDPAIAADLETIVLKAIEKEPDRRYASAADLAADLRRFLAREPIAARPASAAYRFSRFVTRNRLVCGLSAAFLVALVGLLAVVTRLYFQSEAHRRLADERSSEIVRYNETLERIVGALRTGPNGGGAFDETLESSALLESLATHVRRQFTGAARASLLFQVASALEGQGESRKAVPLLKEALGEGSRSPLDPALELRVRFALGAAARRAGELAVAEESFRAASALAPDGVRRAGALSNLAGMRVEARDFREARALYEEAIGLLRREDVGSEPEVGLANALSVYGQFLKTAGEFVGAEAALEESAAIFERARGAASAEVYGPKNSLASLRYRQGRFEEALAIYDGLAASAAAFGVSNPLIPHNLRNNRALVLGSMGRFDEAALVFAEVLEAKRERVGAKDPGVGHTLHDQAQVLFLQGDLDEAERVAREARAIFEASAAGGRDEFLGSIALLLGEIALSAGRLDDAERELRGALDAFGRVLPDDNYRIAEVRVALADRLIRAGRSAEAEPLLSASVVALERTYGSVDPRTRRARDLIVR